jgi:cell division initiation protein
MRLSAIDIKKQEFRKTFRGYDPGEVEAYMETVANEVEKLFREIEAHKEKISDLEKEKEELQKEIQVFKDNEKTFQKAIVKSQDMSESVLENANKRAELIIKESEILAHKTRLQAQQEILNLKQELEDLRINNENIIDDLRNFLIDRLNSIEEYQKQRKIYRIDSDISSLKDYNDDKDDAHKSFDLNIDDKPGY